jgi:hypothetical protein
VNFSFFLSRAVFRTRSKASTSSAVGRACPARRPERVALSRVPLGPRRWLPRLRPGSLRCVRRLHRCRVGGGALRCLGANLRPPLKLDVRFSRIQLS